MNSSMQKDKTQQKRISNVKKHWQVYGYDFAPGEDRSPHYPKCVCYDRYRGGSMLHPAAGGPCYLSRDDQVGVYPR